MTKITSLLFATAFAAIAFNATAGIAPNTGGSAMSQSGAKVAAPKSTVEDHHKEHQNEAKDPAK